ncbi:MAG TPA: 50S ribosomal protein L31, partial [Candidatus Paceibacterota bacterium]|nr:50S ribosomal protein L31 [Candidatus Paceibacterota bacterium]
STVHTTETTKWEDGKEYPKFVVEISSKSHPFYTGEERTLDKAGRVERFKQRAAKKQ